MHQQKINYDKDIPPSKVVMIDWSVYIHKSIFAGIKMQRPPTWLAITMLLNDLSKVVVNSHDIIILACDSHGKGNWRKDLDPRYKANRGKKREDSGIDFETHFCLFENFMIDLEFGTPFYVVEIDRLEADDIISSAVRHYSDKEVVIVSHDSDYDQLFEYKNVKIFSPSSKLYKVPVSNPQAILLKKIEKETTDNLVSPVITEHDYEIRRTIVDLITLPIEIESQVVDVLKFIDRPKENWNINKLSFNSSKKKLSELFDNQDKIIHYEKCIVKKKYKKKVKQQSLI